MLTKKVLKEILAAEFNLLNFLIRIVFMALLVLGMFALATEVADLLVGDHTRYPLGISELSIVCIFTFILLATWGTLFFLMKKAYKKGMLSTAKSFLLIALLAPVACVILIQPYLGVSFPP